ncbi:MAG: hypothetical protein NVSMB42_14920 [Herpetosiphon sp.]
MLNIWAVMTFIGLLTFGIRLSFIVLFRYVAVPDLVMRALRFVPPAVLAAIIAPEVVMSQGRWDLSLHNPRLFAGFIAGFVAWRTSSVLLTIVLGLATLFLVQRLTQ